MADSESPVGETGRGATRNTSRVTVEDLRRLAEDAKDLDDPQVMANAWDLNSTTIKPIG